ncbi:hypothetical protein M1D83_16595 [Enterobacteriaceae bacterium]
MMIVIICTDDAQLEEIARHSIRHHPLVFERKFKVFHNELPQLREDENLFIIAHGAFQGDEGEPVIGDKNAAFYLDGRDCYHNIYAIFPNNYTGAVYVDACESADNSEDMPSFIKTLQYQFYRNGQDIQVYGINGVSSGLIPLPDNPKWQPAEL